MQADLPPKKVGLIFGVSTQTLRDWVDRKELTVFFSPKARGRPGRPAVFDEQDFGVVCSISSLRGQGRDWQQIADTLQTGWRETVLPETAAAVAAQTNAGMQLSNKLGAAHEAANGERRILDMYREETAKEIQRLLDLIAYERNRSDQERSRLDTLQKESTAKIIELTETIGILKGRLEAINKDLA